MSRIHVNVDDELADQYRAYVAQSVDQMRDHLTALSERGMLSDAIRDDIYGVAHNIKGMGSSFGYELMTSVGTLLCKYLSAVTKGELEGDIGAIEAHIRAIEVISEHDIKGDGGDKGKALIERLSVYSDGI